MKIFYLQLFFLGVFTASAQTIPVNRLVDWSVAGYPDSFPNPGLVYDVTNFGAVGDSLFDNATAIRDAIDSLHGNRGVIYFPPGNYIIGSTIDLPDSVILRGASSDSSRLIFDLGGVIGHGFNVTGSVSGVFANVVSGGFRGNDQIVVDDPSSFSVGDYCELIENNGAWDVQPVSWADNSVGQIVRLTYINGDTLFLATPLRIDYDPLLSPRIQKITPATEVGIECLQVSRADSVHTGVCFNIYFNYAANCWIQGVESSRSIGSHIEADASTNLTVSGCYVHDAFEYDGTSTHGYGITLFAHTGQCLITNNIVRHLRHAFSFQTGANGNVLSYNYSLDPNRSESPANFGADISLHGHYPYANLFEGNIVQNIMIDQTWGPSGPFNTFFRNRAELYGIIMTSGAAESDSLNFVGNEVTNTQVLMGNYILAGTAHFEFGNNIKGTITPSGTLPLNDMSYYLTGQPGFWSGQPYPSIGDPNVLGSGSIPARDRYLSGVNFTVCEGGIISAMDDPEKNQLTVYPVPATDRIYVSGNFGGGKILLTLWDIRGRVLSAQTVAGRNDCILELPQGITGGVYLLKVNTARDHFSRKVIILNRD
jgi:hypothetical protein